MMSSNLNEIVSIRNLYDKLCVDLNMDEDTSMDGWRSYEHIVKHYLLEGDQLHWLAVSLYVSCRTNRYLSTSDNNPISISRLLKSANNLSLIVFFDKLHKWQDMANLTENLRKKLDMIEHAFNISSIIFKKYTNIFIQIFGGNQNKFIHSDYQTQRTENQINPKLNQKNKQKKLTQIDLYSLTWTIFALAKTIYPATNTDLIASFNLLIASFEYVYQHCKKAKLDYLLKGSCLNDLYNDGIIDKICSMYSCCPLTCRSIYCQHLKSNLFKKLNESEDLLNGENYLKTIREINHLYDEIVLTNCIIDERIFIENKIQLNDLVNSLNENRNEKSLENRTPLTANQHLTFEDNQQLSYQGLTPISQANQLIQHLYLIIGQQEQEQDQQEQLKPNRNLIEIIGEQAFIDDLLQRIKEWEIIFVNQYETSGNVYLFSRNEQRLTNSSKSRFDFGLKLFYHALENILIIEKKRLISTKQTNQQIHQAFHKLILNNEFLKSLLGLSLLLILFAHSDKCHDLNWILNIYSLHGYSFLKIIQIFLKTLKQINQARAFIKYLSSCEETILSSMAFDQHSALWNEIKLRGILSYQQVFQNQLTISTPPSSSSTNLEQLYSHSPNANHVKRKLFQNSNNNLTIIRSQSDPVVDNVNVNVLKVSPYTIFYRKLYELVLSRLDVLCLRLYGSESLEFEKIVWNLFEYLFLNYTDLLFRSRDLDQILLSIIYYSANSNLSRKDELTWPRLIQAYKSMPNSKLKILRSVFIRKINFNEDSNTIQQLDNNPCLTPSKPAGTIQRIDGNLIGDITSFYKEVFLKIPDIESNIREFFNNSKLIDVPRRTKVVNNQNEHISINQSQNIFIDYSSTQIQSNLFSNQNPQTKTISKDSKTNISSNILSSSIQAGLNNTVRTTRTRTQDGKFLTTISTVSKLNNSPDQFENVFINLNEKNLLFGQSSNICLNNSIKRTLSDDSNSNCLTSLTKKVLQIENDRQKLQQY